MTISKKLPNKYVLQDGKLFRRPEVQPERQERTIYFPGMSREIVRDLNREVKNARTEW